MGKKLSFLKYNFFHFTHQNSSHVAASVLVLLLLLLLSSSSLLLLLLLLSSLFQSETTFYYRWIYFVLLWFCGCPVTQSVLILGQSIWWWWWWWWGVAVCVISGFLKKFLTRGDVTNRLSRNVGNKTEERRSQIAV